MEAIRRHTVSEKLFGIVALALLALGTLSIGAVTFSRPDLPFADARFAEVWMRTDAPAVRAQRTLYWGETPWWSNAEFYRQSVHGVQTVQYFDKGRMELGDADGRDAQPFVHAGLLVQELVSGRVQLGADAGDIAVRQPAPIPVAGDLVANTITPTYADFGAVTSAARTYRDAKQIGQRIDATMAAGGRIDTKPELATVATTIAYYDEVTGHNIPTVFWEFIQQRGLVQTGSQVSSGLLMDWLALTGRPISDAYWVRAQVGGSERDVLVQLFERRVLTYTSSNPIGYTVEFANTGQHYVAWRYPHLGRPWIARVASPTLVYVTTSTNDSATTLHTWNNSGARTIVAVPAGLRPSSLRHSWATDTAWIAGDASGTANGYRQSYAVAVPLHKDTSQNMQAAPLLRLTYSDGPLYPTAPHPGALPNGAANEGQLAVSPDGTKVVFISDRSGAAELFLMPFGGGNPLQLTSSGCANEAPSWSPDGRMILWANNCDGDYELYSAQVNYVEDTDARLLARLSDVRKLTDNTDDDRFPRMSPDGTELVFVSTRTGHSQLYTMRSDGSAERQLLSGDADDEMPAWSLDGTMLAFARNRGGKYQIVALDRKSGQSTTISQGTGDSRWPVWVQ